MKGFNPMTDPVVSNGKPTPRLILGREPAAWTAFVMAAVSIVSSFFFSISPETQAGIQVAVNAVLALVVVVMVRENVVPAIVAVVQAVLPLVVVAGWDASVEQQGVILAVAPLVLGFLFVRPQVTAKIGPEVGVV
ncbi:holin [Gordonia phage Sixama]|uniref:Holin n=1 Tax=Gordonia phage Sixama TaxID=2653271 RepID=A0A5Q2F191_9CAUD|nr:holin [Gordonia phage Sixama]QGF20289.1 holin [Gordonia phage Sixama]